MNAQAKNYAELAGLEAILRSLEAGNVATENLTRIQLAEAVLQMIKSGDIMRHVRISDSAQQVDYLPYRNHQLMEQDRAKLEAEKKALEARAEGIRDLYHNQRHYVDALECNLRHAAYWFDQLTEQDAQRYESLLADWRPAAVKDVHSARAAEILARHGGCNVDSVLETLRAAGLVVVEFGGVVA